MKRVALFVVLLLVGCSPVQVVPMNVLPSTPSPTVLPSPTPSPTLSPSPTPSPTPVVEKSEIEKLVDGMTAEEKIGQLLMFSIRENRSKVFDNTMKHMLDVYSPGGVILFSENIASIEQTKKLVEDLQESSKIPLLIGSDDEGGRVRRVTQLMGYTVGSAQGLRDPEAAYMRGREMGKFLYDVGVTMDFAPVADVNTNPNNTVIGDRAFGSDPEWVADMVAAMVRGLREEKVHSVIKHFPGHGDTTEDSHVGLAKVDHSLERLRTEEFVPFQRGIEAGVDGVMVGHITAPNITGNHEPAVFSKMFVTDILRGELGFDGCIVTDSMQMGAITKYYDSAEAAWRAFEAGADIILMPEDNDAAYHGLLDAYREGRISESRLRESLYRILKLKYPEE